MVTEVTKNQASGVRLPASGAAFEQAAARNLRPKAESPEPCFLLHRVFCRPARQPLDPLRNWWMRREHTSQAHSQERLNNKKMRSRWSGLQRELFGVGVELGQGTRQSIGVTGEVRSSFVRLVLTGTRNRKLNENGRNRRQNQHD